MGLTVIIGYELLKVEMLEMGEQFYQPLVHPPGEGDGFIDTLQFESVSAISLQHHAYFGFAGSQQYEHYTHDFIFKWRHADLHLEARGLKLFGRI